MSFRGSKTNGIAVQSAQTGDLLLGETNKTTKVKKTSKNFAKGVDKRGER